MPGKVFDKDTGYRRIKRNFQRLMQGRSVTIGIQGSQGTQKHKGGITNAALGFIHEFGAPGAGVPQRSFLRSTVDRNRGQIKRMLEKAARNAVDTGDLDQRLAIVGEKVRSEVIETIDKSIGIEPNAPSTIRKKGSSKPLVDSGVLKGAISSKVRKGIK